MIKTRAKQGMLRLCVATMAVWMGLSTSSLVAQQHGPSQPSARSLLDKASCTGGLIVHLGCGDGTFTTALRAGPSYLVHGLDADEADVSRARDHVDSLGLYGVVSVDHLRGTCLPYADNLVNLLVVDDASGIPNSEMQRVLAPGGAICSTRDGGTVTFVKERPETLDDWSHYLHGPDNNAVSQDLAVGPPRHIQWISGPRYSRSHDHLASISALVSAGGRVFFIVDEGSIAFAAASPRWQLVARDAFSGVLLWKREISEWEYHLRDFRSGPADLARRLVATADRVYVTLGYGQPVSALDAATGKTIQTYARTEGALEILEDDGRLFVVAGRPDPDWRAEEAKQLVSLPGYRPPFERDTPPAHDKRIVALDAHSGSVLWEVDQPWAKGLLPSTLAVADDRVFFQNLDAVICLDRASGKLQWQADRPVHRRRLAWSTPTLVVHGDLVFSADRKATETNGELLWIPSGGFHEYIRGDVDGELIAYDGATGRQLWSCAVHEGFNAPVDVLVADGLLWTGRYSEGRDPGFTEARDLRTGEVLRRRPPDQEFIRTGGHAHCHRAKATERYLILGRRGIELVDVKTGDIVANQWVRGMCQYGVMPANGLIYVPPHACACSVTDLIKSGFLALAPERSLEQRAAESEESLHRGLAFDSPTGGMASEPGDWPTYRHDAERSGATSDSVSLSLKPAWSAELGGRLTSPVIARGKLLVAQPDRHRVVAVDADSGELCWSVVVGGPVDSPPTIRGNRLWFGSRDGNVYCLRLEDGALVWRFQAAPVDQRIVVNDQLESPWPVPGNVLVLDGSVYFPAGRNSYLDGGMFLYELDALTGAVRNKVSLAVDEKKRDGGVASGGCLPDVLSSDGESLFMRSSRFGRNLERLPSDVPHLWCSVGFLDDAWWHRTYWQYGTSMSSGWGGWTKAGRRVPAGRLLVTDGEWIFGFGRNQYDIPGAHVGVDGEGVWGPVGENLSRWTYYRLFGKRLVQRPAEKPNAGVGMFATDWSVRIPILAQSMVLADTTLFLAGPVDPLSDVPHQPRLVDQLADALETARGGRLLAVSPTSGKRLAELDLASPPVFDGMAVAGGGLYMATKDGHVVCLRGDATP